MDKETLDKVQISRSPLEVLGTNMELGKAYVYMRGDGSFMIHHNHEMLSDKWFSKTWYDIYKNRIHVNVQHDCILNPISKFNKDFMNGLYEINDETLHILEKAIYSAFTKIAPLVEEIELNALHYDCNEQKIKEWSDRETYMITDDIPFELEPGTCIYQKYRKGYSHLYKIKNKEVMGGSPTPQLNKYACDSFDYYLNFCELSLSHTLSSDYLSKIGDLGFEEKEEYKHCDYIIPLSVYDNFEKVYIDAVKDIQILREKLVQKILQNHKEIYGEEAYKNAEKEAYKWIDC